MFWLLASLLFGIAVGGKKKPTTVPSGGTGGGPGGGLGSPPAPPVPPSAPPGRVFPLPHVGQVYRPNVNTPATKAAAFKGRALIESWGQNEVAGTISPDARHGSIMAALDGGLLDPPDWIRITVRPGFEIEAAGDVVSCGGVRLCGPMRSHQAIADAWGGLIPTPALVDAIWRARTLTLSPQTIGWCTVPGGCTPNNPKGEWINPGGGVGWLLYFADRVAEEIQSRALQVILSQPGALLHPVLSAESKDYTLSPSLLQRPTQCEIYGWQWPDGKPIQPMSHLHELPYFDYSHNFRIVRNRCWVGGVEASLADVYRTRPDFVNIAPGMGPCPVRHPAIPPRAGGGIGV